MPVEMVADARPILFPSVITGSRWGTVWQSTFSAALKRRGKGTAPDGETMVPRLTNREAVALVRAWVDAAGVTRFPLWAQFAGQAYGWNPTRDNRLDASEARRDRLMSVAITHELWVALYKVAGDFDDEDPPTIPQRLVFDAGAFDDPVYQATVRAGLASDGAVIPQPQPSPVAAKRTRRPAPASSTSILAPVLVLGALWLVFGKRKPSRRYRRI